MTTRFVMPFAFQMDGNGDPLAGGKLYFYRTGTSTPKDTYTTRALSVANANPVVADSAGRWGDIFLATDELYKVVLKDSADATIKTLDPVGPADTVTDSALVEHTTQGADAVAVTLKSRLQDDHISVMEFGAVGDGSTDDILAIEAAIAAAKLYERNLYFPPGYSFAVSRKVAMGDLPRISVIMLSPIKYTGSSHITILEVGDPAVTGAMRLNDCWWWVQRSAQTDWTADTSETSIGIQFNGIRGASTHHILEVTNCTIGAQITGGITAAKLSGEAVWVLGLFSNCRFGVELYRASSASSYGCNSHLFIGGTMGISAALYPATTRAAVSLRAPNGGTIDGNHFTGFLSQLNESNVGYAVWIRSREGTIFQNRFEANRHEFGSTTAFKNDCRLAYENLVDVQYATDTLVKSDASDYPMTNTLTQSRPYVGEKPRWCWHSGLLAKMASDYNGTNYHVPNIGWAPSGTASHVQAQSAGTVSVAGDIVTVGAGAAPVVRVDTRTVKQFALKADVTAAFRLFIRPFDSNGGLIDVRKVGTNGHAKRAVRVSILNAGSGYTDGSYSLTISGGGATTAATATATVAGGIVTAITVTDGGEAYTGQPTISLPAGAGAGTGFAAELHFAHVVGNLNTSYTTQTSYITTGDLGMGARTFAKTSNQSTTHGFSVDAGVGFVDLILARISSDYGLREFSVYALAEGDASVSVPGVATPRDRRGATVVPATLRGTYQKGEVIDHLDATTGQVAGWLCGTAGTLGTLASATTADMVSGRSVAFIDTGGSFATIYPGEYVAVATAITSAIVRRKLAVADFPAWAANTAVGTDSICTNDTGKVYICMTAGTTAASGGPTGTGTGIADGTATWDYVGTTSLYDGALFLSSNASGAAASQAVTLAAPAFLTLAAVT